MSDEARYSGICPECDGRWQPGDSIRTGDDHQWVHATCPDQPDDPTPLHPICTTCWLEHPEGECDR